MQDARARTRQVLETLVSAWLAGDAEAVIDVFDPTVRWWTRFNDTSATGPYDAWAALDQVVAAVPCPIEVTALIVNEDGSRGVVEMRTATATGPRPSMFVTSVVRFSAGIVVEGLTYTDLDAEDVSAQG